MQKKSVITLQESFQMTVLTGIVAVNLQKTLYIYRLIITEITSNSCKHTDKFSSYFTEVILQNLQGKAVQVLQKFVN